MRVCFISTNHWVAWGGSEVLWTEAAKKLALTNNDIFVYSKKWEPLPQHLLDLEKCGCQVFYHKEADLPFIKRLSNRILPSTKKFVGNKYNFLKNSKFDLIVYSLGDQNEGYEIISASREKGIPYVIVVQLAKDANVRPDGAIAEIITKNYLEASRVFFVSRDNQLIVEKQIAGHLQNAEIIFNPIPFSAINTSIPFPAAPDYYSLGFVASLSVNHKGHDLLFEVLADKRWRERNLIINLYGSGFHKNYIKKLVKFYSLNCINNMGNYTSVQAVWSKNHAAILPSRMEGQSLALLEAMAYGRMPITTNLGGASYLIRDNVDGFIAKAPTVEAIDEALDRAWQKRDLWEMMGVSCQRRLFELCPNDPVDVFTDKIMQIAATL